MTIIICKCLYKSVNTLLKKVIKHINDNLSDFSYSDGSDEEQRLVIFERAILEMYFLREQFQKNIS